jgi:hypothetical protein
MRLIIFLLCFVPHIVLAQTTHTVDDPEIRFSLLVPERWRVEDDGYTLAIVPPKGGSEYFDFTYFETEETTVDRTLEFTLNAFNDPDVTEFEVIKQSEEEINGVVATKVTADLLLKDEPFRRLIYLLIKDGQMYILRGHAKPENFEYFQPFFERIARSLQTELI